MLIELTTPNLWYEKFYYPAGEMQVRLKPSMVVIPSPASITILARLQSSDQIIELLMLKDAIRAASPESRIDVIVPYWPYARADRRFVPGDSFALAVFSRLMTTLGSRIFVLDVHSAKSLELVDSNWVYSNFIRNVSPTGFIQAAAMDFANAHRITILFPDAGSVTRYALPTCLGTTTLTFRQAEKVRDPATGKLSGFKVPARQEFPDQPVLIVDDICDGGGTFLGIADAMAGYDLPLALYVTHGIFSKGLTELLKRFDRIYTTDSFHSSASGTDRDWARVEVYPCLDEILKVVTG